MALIAATVFPIEILIESSLTSSMRDVSRAVALDP